jgi:hypothetical protein
MQHRDTKKTRHHSNSNSSTFATGLQFESLAFDLNNIAKDKLPDGCLDGALRGEEPEIRQDAMLLALRWYAQTTKKEEWNAARSLSYALRFIKLRYARRLSMQPEYVQLMNDAIPANLVVDPQNEPLSSRPQATQMAIQAIHQATHKGQITPANAAIVLMVLEDGYGVSTIARSLNLGKGTIYYHFNQVRAIIPAIVENMEEPGYEKTLAIT